MADNGIFGVFRLFAVIVVVVVVVVHPKIASMHALAPHNGRSLVDAINGYALLNVQMFRHCASVADSQRRMVRRECAEKQSETFSESLQSPNWIWLTLCVHSFLLLARSECDARARVCVASVRATPKISKSKTIECDRGAKREKGGGEKTRTS